MDAARTSNTLYTAPSWISYFTNLHGGQLRAPLNLYVNFLRFKTRRERMVPSQGVSLRDTTFRPRWVKVSGRGLFYIKVCWNHDGPAAQSGSYLSAQFPTEGLLASGTWPLTDTLGPNSGNLTNYTVQSQVAPSTPTPYTWQWTNSDIGLDGLGVTAISLSGTRHDNFRGFLSRVTLGVAGGALIAILAELMGPLSRRRDDKYSDDGRIRR